MAAAGILQHKCWELSNVLFVTCFKSSISQREFFIKYLRIIFTYVVWYTNIFTESYFPCLNLWLMFYEELRSDVILNKYVCCIRLLILMMLEGCSLQQTINMCNFQYSSVNIDGVHFLYSLFRPFFVHLKSQSEQFGDLCGLGYPLELRHVVTHSYSMSGPSLF